MSTSLCLPLSKADHPQLAILCLVDRLPKVKAGCSERAVFSLPSATSPSTALQSDGTGFLAGLHCSDSGLEHKLCSWAGIACPHQNGRGKHCSVQVTAKDTKPQREAKQHISSVCELKT